MASELKPCPFCGAAAKAKPMGSASFTVMCENLHRMNSFPSKDEAIAAWNTRPAPAATDTGLVTIGYMTEYGGVWLQTGELLGSAVVTRSQAEELLAAKDREVEAAMVIYRAERKWRSELEAKLAAAEQALETKSAANEALSKSVVESIDTEKRLRDALEPFGVFGDETISPARRHFLQLLICPEGDEHPQDYGPHFRKARAVLGGKPL